MQKIIMLIIAGLALAGCATGSKNPGDYAWELPKPKVAPETDAAKRKYGFYLSQKQVEECIKATDDNQREVCIKKLKAEITRDTLVEAYRLERGQKPTQKSRGGW